MAKLLIKPAGQSGPVEIAFEDQGSGSAIVLLHGYPFDRTMWRDQLDELSREHRIIAPDLRGLGETEVSPGTVRMEQMAADVAALLENLNIRHATIAGLSMGGYVALAFWRSFPERVRALVLADTRAQPDTDEARQNRTVQAEKALKEGMAGIVDAMLPKLLASETVEKQPNVVKRLREMMSRTKPEGAAAALRGMAERQDQRPFLSRIITPTLILVGRDDAITPLEDSQTMHRQIDNSQLQIIEYAGHVSNMERPREFNEALLGFLREHNL